MNHQKVNLDPSKYRSKENRIAVNAAQAAQQLAGSMPPSPEEQKESSGFIWRF